MSGRTRGKKRKSEDFICEINDEDLSPDENEHDEGPCKKMNKFDTEIVEISNSEETSNDIEPKLVNPESSNDWEITLTDDSIDMKAQIQTQEDASPCEQDILDIKNSESMTVSTENSEVIEIDDNRADADESVVIIEDHIPVMVVSDDDEEEGEIIEELQVVDEVTATPQTQHKLEASESLPQDNNILKVSDIEFRVIEEIGPSPKPKQDELIKISFRCDKVMSQYGHLLVKFFKTFPELDVQRTKLQISVKEGEYFEENQTPKKKNKKKKAKKDLFIVDTNPSSNDNSQFLQFRYTRQFEIGEQSEDAGNTPVSSKICFNCDGDHALRDCNIPRNFQKINQARQQFLDKYKTVRYHVEHNEKLAHLKPGVISDGLRAALGLKKNEIPSYIYRMRNLGYPPGWLEEAKVSSSSLSLFNIDGKKVEGQKKITSSIDPSKIIEYPGFNIPPKKGSYDEFKKHRVKPYNKSMHKSAMIKYYEDIFQKDPVEDSPNKDSPQKSKSTKEVEVVKNSVEAPVSSPSLVTLEEKKKELIDELNSNESDEKLKSDKSEDILQETVGSKSENKEPVVVKTTEFGTPILKSNSPYSRLPNPDNFSVGVSPVIDFENLPNSTGKYEELSKVLSKVRMTMKNIL